MCPTRSTVDFLEIRAEGEYGNREISRAWRIAAEHDPAGRRRPISSSTSAESERVPRVGDVRPASPSSASSAKNDGDGDCPCRRAAGRASGSTNIYRRGPGGSGRVRIEVFRIRGGAGGLKEAGSGMTCATATWLAGLLIAAQSRRTTADGQFADPSVDMVTSRRFAYSRPARRSNRAAQRDPTRSGDARLRSGQGYLLSVLQALRLPPRPSLLIFHQSSVAGVADQARAIRAAALFDETVTLGFIPAPTSRVRRRGSPAGHRLLHLGKPARGGEAGDRAP